jgi:hypothetical protein
VICVETGCKKIQTAYSNIWVINVCFLYRVMYMSEIKSLLDEIDEQEEQLLL